MIPQRKRTGADPIDGDEDNSVEKHDLLERKELCVEVPLESGS